MKRLPLLACLFLSACGGHAGPYRIAPVEPTALSPSAAPVFYVVPFQDKRHQSALYTGRSRYEDVLVEAQGITAAAKAWQSRPWGSVAWLWHRAFVKAMAGSGADVAAATDPIEDDAVALKQASAAGAKYLLSGRIDRLEIGKVGADDLLNTNFSGTNYPMHMEVRLRVLKVPDGQPALDKPWTYDRRFFDPTRLGSPDQQTFPSFFLVGLQDASLKLSGQADLRTLAGLPAYTATPTPTLTPMAIPPTPGPSPTPAPTAAPTPDDQPYWVNPKTGHKVDPAWNFDPEDGTPRDAFILRQPTPRPTPVRPTAPR